MVRLGIPACFSTFVQVANDLRAPILVSANAFAKHGRLRAPRRDLFGDADLALDSAGFVAMVRYGGYPWPTCSYLALVHRLRPTWWAARDFCCEPQIAGDRAAVAERIRLTVVSLAECREQAEQWGVPDPMPVLQGWRPDDYLRCAEMMGDLPALVGVGSVCRRQLGGADGIFAVLRALDRLPQRVRLHLFGVKGSAVGALAGHPRIASVDSMAWDFAARRERERNGVASCSTSYRAGYMRRWYGAQRDHLGLFAP